MGLFDFLRSPDINQGLNEYSAVPGAVLLDVRRNVPLQSLEQAAGVISDKSTPVFVYCYSGSRSSQAVSRLIKMGYQNVKNIGGIASYSGKVEM